MLALMSSSAPTRARSAGFLAAAAVVIALWAPVAAVTGLPFAVAAGASGVGLSALADVVDRDDRRAPGAFLVCLAIVGVALVLHVTR